MTTFSFLDALPQVGLKSPADPSTPHLPNTTWPAWLQKGLDTDVLVSEVRETSRKPDEGALPLAVRFVSLFVGSGD